MTRLLLSYVPMSMVSSLACRRKLFWDLAKFRRTSLTSVATLHTHFSPFPESHSLMPASSVGHNVELKRGDWVCSRCSFMNFAKNKTCLKCELQRPNKVLTGGEWECPQCDFFNFSRNAVCLRCGCKKLNLDPQRSPVTVSGSGTNDSLSNSNTGKPLADSEGEQQRWFTKITELEKSSALTSSVSEEEFSKFIQASDDKVSSRSSNLATDENPNGIDLKLGEFITQKSSVSYIRNNNGDSGESQRDKSPLDTSSSSFASSNNETSASVNEQQLGEDLPEIMPMRTGENRFVVSKKKDRSLTSPSYKRRAAMEPSGGNNHVPFVPFPPGYFSQGKSDSAKASSKPQRSADVRTAMPKSTIANQQTGATIRDPGVKRERNEPKVNNSTETKRSSRTDFRSASQARETSSVEENFRRGTSLEGSAVTEVDPLDMSEEAKAERWFRRVAQIKDISELSQIPDEDFPSIMPLRKGVNRFVVSKRKTPLERRLTSSQYKTNHPITTNEPFKNTEKTESN